jgi:hypothetical protein
MISPFDMYSASTPVIAMKPIGCLRFLECPRAGGAGRVIFFKGQNAVPWTRANRDAASQASEVSVRLYAFRGLRINDLAQPASEIIRNLQNAYNRKYIIYFMYLMGSGVG